MKTLEISPLTSDRLEELCKRLPFADFRYACNRMSYDQLYQLHVALGSRIADTRASIERKGEGDQLWAMKAKAACGLMEDKRQIVVGRMVNLRTAAITALGSNGGVESPNMPSRLNMIRSLVIILANHVDISRLAGNERAAYDSCCEVIGLEIDPLIEFNGITYNPNNKMITDANCREIAFVSRPLYDVDEVGYKLAAVSSLIDLSSQAIADAENTINSISCSKKNSCIHCRAIAYVAKAKPIMDQLK